MDGQLESTDVRHLIGAPPERIALHFQRLVAGLQERLRVAPGDLDAHRDLGCILLLADKRMASYFHMGRFLEGIYSTIPSGAPLYLAEVGKHDFLRRILGECALEMMALAMIRDLGILPPARMVLPFAGQAPTRPLLECMAGPVELLDGSPPPGSFPFYVDFFPLKGLGLDRERACVALWSLWEKEGRPPPFRLPDFVVERGEAYLRSLGIREGENFVCLHFRGAGFHADWDQRALTGC